MLARTSPALAADSGHGQGKAHDQTSASAVANRHDSPTAKEDQQIGGAGDGSKGKGKGGGGTTGSGAATGGSSQTSGNAAAKASATTQVSTSAQANGTPKGSDNGAGKSNGSGASPATVTAKSLDKATEGNADNRGDTAGGKTGNGDDKTKVKVVRDHVDEVGNSTGSTGAGSANTVSTTQGGGGTVGGSTATGTGTVSGATASGGTGQVLAATGAPIAGGLVGGILFLLGGLGLRRRRK